MSFRRGVNRLLVVVIILWEIVCLSFLALTHGDGDPTFFIGLMFGIPVVLFGVVRALFWIMEGFIGSSLK